MRLLPIKQLDLSGLYQTTNVIHVAKNNILATDVRTGLSKYSSYKPFSSIVAALAVASAGDLIKVHFGVYDESITLVTGVNLYFYEGSELSKVTSGVAVVNADGVTCTISGHGVFSGGDSSTNGVFKLTNFADVTIIGKSINATEGSAINLSASTAEVSLSDESENSEGSSYLIGTSESVLFWRGHINVTNTSGRICNNTNSSFVFTDTNFESLGTPQQFSLITGTPSFYFSRCDFDCVSYFTDVEGDSIVHFSYCDVTMGSGNVADDGFIKLFGGKITADHTKFRNKTTGAVMHFSGGTESKHVELFECILDVETAGQPCVWYKSDAANVTFKFINGSMSPGAGADACIVNDTAGNVDVSVNNVYCDDDSIYCLGSNITNLLPDAIIYPDTKIGNFKTPLTTGWVGTPPVISINAGDNTKYDCSGGTLLWVDHTVNPPVVKEYTFAPIVAGTDPLLTTGPSTHFSAKVVGGVATIQTLAQQLTNEQRRDYASIGVLPHTNQINYDAGLEIQNPVAIEGAVAQLHDLMSALGMVSISGNNIKGVSGTLSVSTDGGTALSKDANPGTKDPHKVVFPLDSSISMFRTLQDGTLDSISDFLDPTFYDNAGVKTTVPANNNATVPRLYVFPSGVYVIMYGQEVFSNFTDAKAAALKGNESFVLPADVASRALFLGRWVVKKNATNTDDITEAEWFPASGISGGGASLTTLQQAYEISIEPEILLNSIRNAFTLQSHTNTENSYEGKNVAGAVTFAVDGNGDITTSGQINGKVVNNTVSGHQVDLNDANGNLRIKLNNNDGTNKLTIVDSDDNEVAFIDSNGSLQVKGFLGVNDDAPDLTISSGSITPVDSFHRVLGEGSADDELTNTSVTNTKIGDLLILEGNSNNDIRIRNSVGNINLRGGDFWMSGGAAKILLIRSGSNWHEIARNSTAEVVRRKTIFQDKTDTTLTSITDLELPVLAGQVYVFTYNLFAEGEVGNIDLDLAFNDADGLAGDLICSIRHGSNGNEVLNAFDTRVAVGVSTSAKGVIIDGSFKCTTSGTLKIQMAQETADVADYVRILEGSTLVAKQENL